jgi:dihydroorotase
MLQYDLLLKGGEVLLPATSFRGKLDVAISQGRIVAMRENISADEAKRVLDVRDKLVVPGLIDLHTHLGFELHTQVVDPNVYCPPAGVTTAVDMGSTGAFNFLWYKDRVLSRTQTRLYAFINIASIGTTAIHTPYYVDNYGRYIDVPDTIRTIEENRQHIRGIKVFATSKMTGDWALDAVRAAVRVGDAVELPVAVHISQQPPALEAILTLLRKGDIITHTYTPHDQGILDERGRIRSEVKAARHRGVIFDLGHGAGSFSFEVARKALAQDFPPDTISTDIYYVNIETPVKDLPTTLSKLLNLGLSLEETIARATYNPAQALGDNRLGTLELGHPADVTILSLHEGQFTFVDSKQETLQGKWKLECEATIFDGEVVYQRATQ